jgi:hypothetical protein
VLLLAISLACTPEPPNARAIGAPMDGRPSRRTASPGREWEALVVEGALSIRPFGRPEAATAVRGGVHPEVAFSPDGGALVFAAEGLHPETDLWLLALPPDAPPAPLTDWRGSEDRPVFSPDGRQLAFVSGRTGVASLWALDLETGEERQLTNLGAQDRPRAPGRPPAGSLPPPDPATLAWDDAGLTWVAGGERYRVAP